MAKRAVKVLALAGAMASLANAAAAQTPPAPTREEIRRDPVSPIGTQTPARPVVEDAVERAPCPLAQPRFAGVSFTLNGVEFADLAEVPAEALRPAFAQYLGQRIPIGAICDIRDRAATILRSRGYLAAVQVPPQEIGADGIVRLDVLMARVSRLQVRGETGNSSELIEGYLYPLVEGGMFNQRTAERYLMLARELPGFDTRLTLRPAGAPGEVIGDVRVERTRFVVEGNVQNFGPVSSGRFGGQVRAQINDLTGMGDSTVLGVFASADFDEQLVLTIGHEFAVGGSGLRIGGEFTYAWNDPTIAGTNPFDTETLIATAQARYPFVLDQGTRITGTAGFEFIDQTIMFGSLPLSEDNLRVAFARVDGLFTDRESIDGRNGFSAFEPRWRLGFSAELRQGLDLFGASDAGLPPAIPVPQSRAFGEADATVLRAEALAELRPSPGLAFVLQPRFQIATGPLLAYEEFSGGNYTVGRGYDPGSVIGDHGAGFRSEIRIGTAIPRNREQIVFQPYGFFDAAWVWNDDPGLLAGMASDELYSAGGGVRAVWGDRARFDMALAVPLAATNLQASTPDPRLLMSLTLRFAR